MSKSKKRSAKKAWMDRALKAEAELAELKKPHPRRPMTNADFGLDDWGQPRSYGKRPGEDSQ